MRDVTSSDGVYAVLKVVDDDTDELAILKYLNDIKSAANHTIGLHGTVHNSIANVIALRWRIPLDEYFRFHHPPESAASFPEQFLDGVAFLHEYRVAHHLDLKPGNVVVGEHTTIEGFCGTPPWVAPEVGARDGPDMRYSADRWACG
jgi:serine/threonine protein kinase